MSDEIHIWLGILDQPVSESYRFIQALSLDERMRAERFHFQRDRKRFIIRHGMLRMILGFYLGVKASQIAFDYGVYGKPAITEPFGKGTIRFNISHSDGIALFAFLRDHEIGIDIEHVRDVPEMEQIVDRFFSAREKAFINALYEGKKREEFFNCWTGKEAFIKAIGEGLSCALDSFEVTPMPSDGDTPRTIQGDSGGMPEWSIHSLRFSREYVGALAAKNKSFTLRYFKWDYSSNRDLLN